eukprot:1003207-Pleurochrysis_carterae.AAC.1
MSSFGHDIARQSMPTAIRGLRRETGRRSEERDRSRPRWLWRRAPGRPGEGGLPRRTHGYDGKRLALRQAGGRRRAARCTFPA